MKIKMSTRDLMLASLFTALMIAGAFIRIPFPLLPVTLQAFICAVAGIVLGPRLGVLSMTAYTLLGLSGIPVFAQGGGIAYVFNGSFGFIIGFIAGTYVIGKISGQYYKPSRIILIKAVLAGLVTIYAAGITYMFAILRFYAGNTEAGLIYVITVNLPYLVKDTILFLLAALGCSYILPKLKIIQNH